MSLSLPASLSLPSDRHKAPRHRLTDGSHVPGQVVMENSLAQIDLLTKQYKQQFDIPYLPTLSTAWDSSPRTLPSDGCKRL